MALIAALACTACAPDAGGRGDGPTAPDYGPAAAAFLTPDLVQVRLEMRGARDERDVTDYADCVIAGFGQANGIGFARHLRTSLQEAAGHWSADAIYSVSRGFPAGLRTIDIEAQASACEINGIPQEMRANG